MSCFWRDLRNMVEDCDSGELPPSMGLFKNATGLGNPTDTPDPFSVAEMWCDGPFAGTVFGILSGHVVLVTSTCDLLAAPVNDILDAPDTCDAATLIAALHANTTVATEFDVGAVPYDPDWTNADIGLSATGYGVYRVSTSLGDRTWIVLAHTCY